MMKFWAKLTCKRIGHQWSPTWDRDESDFGRQTKVRGYDRFTNDCMNGCGEQRDITQHEEITKMYGIFLP